MSTEFLLEILEKLVQVAIVVGIAYFVRWAQWRFSDDELQIIKDIVFDGVLYSQQVWGHLGGKERYDFAMAKISEELRSRGINISPERLDLFIESAVKFAKHNLVEQWKDDNQ